MTLKILTLSWNGLHHLKSLRDNLLPLLKELDGEWFIKSNGCTDGTIDEVKTWGGNVNPVAYKDNLQNFSEGCNYLFNVACPKDNDLVMLLNNDILFHDTSSISKMISHLKDNVGVVGSKLLYPDKKTLQHAGVVFTPKYRLPINYRAGEKDDANSSKNRYFQAITGAIALMRAGTYRALGKNKSGNIGLDEEFQWAFDDVDMCLQIRYNLGKKVVYVGDTLITHQESATLKKNAVNKLFLNKNAMHLLHKWGKLHTVDVDQYRSNQEHNLI
jgi:GT2 family glycosyltransferase